ncbi:MAG: DUF560 domain-containing protein, partial [Sulfurimonas sp.]|nr:DUF560 domain-containing protein [Sulfurimonas sp.]
VSISPRFEYKHTNTLKSMAHFKYKIKYFTQDISYDLNANHYELGYSLQDILSPHSYIRANLVGVGERKRHGVRTDVDYDEYRFNVAYVNQFSDIYRTKLFAEYRKRNYVDEATIYYSNKRTDDAGTIAATINAKILKTLQFHLKGMYNKVVSNQDRFDYHKYTVTLGLNKTF